MKKYIALSMVLLAFAFQVCTSEVSKKTDGPSGTSGAAGVASQEGKPDGWDVWGGEGRESRTIDGDDTEEEKKGTIVGLYETDYARTSLGARHRVTAESIFGGSWNSTSKAVSERIGQSPVGEFRISNNRVLHFWSCSFAVAFEDNHISKVYLARDSLLDLDFFGVTTSGISSYIIDTGGGLRFGMEYGEVERLLKARMGKPGYITSIEADGLSYELYFVRVSNPSEKFLLRGMVISLSKASNATKQSKGSGKD